MGWDGNTARAKVQEDLAEHEWVSRKSRFPTVAVAGLMDIEFNQVQVVREVWRILQLFKLAKCCIAAQQLLKYALAMLFS